MNIGLILLNLFSVLLGSIASFTLYQLGYPLLALSIVLFTALTLLLFTHPKFYLVRFLYPGLITFFFLMVLPIASTLIISASNLSTGHFMSQDQARGLILEEKFLAADSPLLSFEIYQESPEKFLLVVDKIYAAQLVKLEKVHSVILDKNLSSVPTSNTLLTPAQTIEVFKEFDDILFIHPDYPEYEFLFYRSDLLAATRFTYSLDAETIVDNRSNISYIADKERGRFISESGHILSPGFYSWVGLKNYLVLIQNKDLRESFLKVFVWTVVWGFLSVFLSFSLGVTLAIIINDKNLKMKGIYRGLLILPYSIPFFISVLIFKGMLNQDFGLINQILSSLSLPMIPWLHDGLWAKVACLMVNLWLGFPYMFLVTTGILQSIPESIYEAAKLDGAGPWARFKCLTLPLIMSAVGPLLIGSFAFNINNFVGIYLLTGGGPPMEGASTQVGQTDILISYTYRLAFEGGQGQDFGLASSIAVIIFVIVATLTILNFKLFKTDSAHG